ncbi:hypothetical protein [Tabrizicola sp. BL-A-41-H6]|uniref:hypothetical protein n=1 Tax=Tabrizicola sp. BL-A-41-H6 TaxID=3421107 RepID=UPI003D6747F1
MQGLSCSRRWPVDLDAGLVLIGAGAVVVIAQAVLLIAVLRVPSRSRFVQGTAATLALAALVVGLCTMVPLLVTSACR